MPGVLDPDELKVVESVFEEACRRLDFSRGSTNAENLASKIMLLHESGLDDRDQLLAAAIKQSDADLEKDQAVSRVREKKAGGASGHQKTPPVR